MKSLTLCLSFIVIFMTSHGQTFEWVRSAPVNYSFNPSYTSFPMHYNRSNHTLVTTRLEVFDNIYGVSVLGTYVVEQRDSNGLVNWQFTLGQECMIHRVVSDAAGNVFVGGQFQDNMIMNGTDTMFNIAGNPNFFNWFVIMISPQGTLSWARNMFGGHPQFDEVSALAIDPQGNLHVGVTDFFDAKIIMMDILGNDIVNHTFFNGKRIGNISFDQQGGMYVSGAAEQGIFIMDTDTSFASSAYNMFIARFKSDGSPDWVHFGHDITFQEPMVVTDADGNALFAGQRFDSTSFNGMFINQSQMFGGDFFVIKFDSLGTPMWSVKQPPLLIGPFGSVEIGNNLFIDVDASGKLYLGGLQQGFVDWGNGYTSNTGNFTERKTMVACIDQNGSTQWVKLGGGSFNNYLHSISVSEEGSCYFTGSFMDTATFDNIFIPSTAFFNYMIGKIRVITSSVDDPENDVAVMIYPNPASDAVMLKNVEAGADIRVLDIAGRVVMQLTASGDNQMIDVSSLSSGSYLVRITTESGKVIGGRLVKND